MSMPRQVRISHIELNHFKNVAHGSVSLEKPSAAGRASILGLFGQNGSGKTALLQSIELLTYVLQGKSIPQKFADFIQLHADQADFTFIFRVNIQDSVCRVVYAFSLRRETFTDDSNVSTQPTAVQSRPYVACEQLKLSCRSPARTERMTVLFHADEQADTFTPVRKYHILAGPDEGTRKDVRIARILARRQRKSFLFSAELLRIIRQNCQDPLYLGVLEALVTYGNFELFYIDTTSAGLISLNGLPLSFHLMGGATHAVGHLMVPIDRPQVLPLDQYALLNELVRCMNEVLQSIVPHLTIAVKDLGRELMHPSGDIGQRVEFVSLKNQKEIPLKYESEGIKKIISILQLLIEVYNNPSITIVIDELDSGIFEYLLGELLAMIEKNGRGQLIFTSHNLRPLESLSSISIAFTTTDPGNRYVRIPNIKKSNNLRAVYYRNLILGDNTYSFYDETDNYRIALAFRKAGALQQSSPEENHGARHA